MGLSPKRKGALLVAAGPCSRMRTTAAPVKFEYWKSSIDQQWYWHLKTATNEKLAQGERYSAKADCLRAIEMVRQSATAEIKNLSRETAKY